MEPLSQTQSINYFLWGCIPARAALASLPLWIGVGWASWLAIILLMIAVGFLWLYFSHSRLDAPEGGGQTWWHSYRWIHGVLYLLASWAMFKQHGWAASGLLFTDLAVGIYLFYQQRLAG